MKITIRKIAEMAGVSRSAVDKVIHNRPGVREEVRERVLKIIDETGYVPLHQELPPVESGKTAAVILPRTTNPYFRELKAGMDQACASVPGVSLEYYYCDTTDVEGLLAILDFLEERPIDLYMIRGVRSERVKNRLNQLQKPIVFLDSVVPGAKKLCFIGEDCYKSGRIAASLLAKTVRKGGEVAVVSGSPEVSGHKLRLEGFLDAMQERRPDIRVVEQIYSHDQSVIAYEKTCKVLDQHPNLCGICNLAGHAGEVGQAILDRRKKDSVKLVCYNATDAVTALVRRGIVEFSIQIAPYRQGRIVMETVQQYLITGKKPAHEFICTPVSILMDENIDLIEEGMM